MSPQYSNIDIVPLDHYENMLETSIDVVANHCVRMSDEPFDSVSNRPLIISDSPDRGPKAIPPQGVKQVRNKHTLVLAFLITYVCNIYM